MIIYRNKIFIYIDLYKYNKIYLLVANYIKNYISSYKFFFDKSFYIIIDNNILNKKFW